MASSQHDHDPFAEDDSSPKPKRSPQKTGSKKASKPEPVGVYSPDSDEFKAKHNIHNPELLSFVQRLENIKDEMQELNDHQKDLLSEMKDRGFDVAIVKEILKFRKDSDGYLEKIALTSVYANGIGMNFDLSEYIQDHSISNVGAAFAEAAKNSGVTSFEMSDSSGTVTVRFPQREQPEDSDADQMFS